MDSILKVVIVSFALLAAACAQAPAAPTAATANASYRVINFLPAFWTFWDKAKDLDEASQVKLLQTMVTDKYPEAYKASVIGLDDSKPCDVALAERWHRLLPWIKPHMATARRVSDSIERDLPRFEAKFRETFPDMAYKGDVYFMASLGGFDGATREVNGHSALMFGADVIAAVYGDDADPQPFFHHELFHIYHQQFLGEQREGDDPLGAALWREGLAVYVAKALNPSAEGVALFGLPLNTPERTKPIVPELAKQLRQSLKSTSRDDYRVYFLGSKPDEKIPARSGYYVGYLVAQKVARHHSLLEMAHMKLPEVMPEIEQALDELSGGK